MRERSVARFAAPAAFLAAVTIGVLVVRAGLEHGASHPPVQTTTGTTQTETTQKRKHHATQQHPATQTYTVQSGDTFDSIARKTGTTVARIEQLNPGIDPTTLHVGQKIRVK